MSAFNNSALVDLNHNLSVFPFCVHINLKSANKNFQPSR
jgi:hypothetical protein